MRRWVLLFAGLALFGSLAMPRTSEAWFSGGLGIGYAGALPCAAGFPGPVCSPPIFVAPAFVPWPPVYWPGYDADIAVRLNQYFAPRDQDIRGYTLPR